MGEQETKREPRMPQIGEIREIGGERYCWTDSGYTVRQYFSHSTSEKGPGPGWDFRMSNLLDKEWAISHIGRTFSREEIMNQDLPDIPYFHWVAVED